MTQLRVEQVMGDHGVEQRARYPDIVLAEDHDIEFDVLSYFL